MMKWRFAVILLIAFLSFSILNAQEEITLESFTNETFGIEGLVPSGWAEASPGIYQRGQGAFDVVLLIQQAAPGTADQIAQSLLPSLGLSELPSAVREFAGNGLDWMVYFVPVESPVGLINVDLAIAEADGIVYLILLQALEADYEVLHPAVFEPVLAAYAPLGAEDDEAPANDDSTYTDPLGLYEVPIPTNWALEEFEGYVRLTTPEDAPLVMYFLVLPGEDRLEAIAQAWEQVEPGFDLTYPDSNLIEIEDAALLEGADAATAITYTTAPDRITQAIAIQYEGLNYLLLVDTPLVVAQQRAAQLNIINTGWTILALDQVDLSEATPLLVDDAILDELRAFINRTLEDYNTPGAAVAIVQGGEIILLEGFGVKDRETNEPILPTTRLAIGSITKTMTTFMMASMVDEGVIAWDQPVIEIYPDFRLADDATSAGITFANLVCACTGVPRRDFELIFNSSEQTGSDSLAILAEFQFFTQIGEAFQYSNQMVAAGGFIAALAAEGDTTADVDAAFASQFQQRLLDPIGMRRSTLSLAEATADEDVATGHATQIDGTLIALPFSYEQFAEPIAPAGALWSTAEDMAQYLLTMMNQGTTPAGITIAQPATVLRLWEPQVPISANSSYGLGWFVEDYKGAPVLSHGGTMLGFQSEMAFLPQADLGIVVLSNRNGSVVPQLLRTRLLEIVFEQEPLAEAQLLAADALMGAAREDALAGIETIPADVQAGLAGTYTNAALGTIVLEPEGDTFFMDAGEFRSEVRQSLDDDTGEMSYILIDPPLPGVTFTAREDGTLTLGSGVIEYIFEPASS